jgi:hypothetical protein
MGGGLKVALIPGEGGGFFPIAQVRVHIGKGVSAELAAHFGRGLYGFYELRVRSTPPQWSGRVAPFVTVGGIGSFESYRIPERRTTTPTGDVVIYPASRYGRVTRPFALAGGGGATFHLPAGLSIDAGGELWFSGEDGILLSFQTSVIVPLWGGKR